MSELIKRARLTDEEQYRVVSVTNHRTTDVGAIVQAVADAQLRKALLVVTEWLGEQKLIGEDPSAELVALFRELHPDLGVNENVEVT